MTKAFRWNTAADLVTTGPSRCRMLRRSGKFYVPKRVHPFSVNGGAISGKRGWYRLASKAGIYIGRRIIRWQVAGILVFSKGRVPLYRYRSS
jgi:hypothetical protein